MRRPQTGADISKISDLPEDRKIAVLMYGKVCDEQGRYLHWNQMRFRKPPSGLTLEEWWLATRFARQSQERYTPLANKAGMPFFYSLPPVLERDLHHLTQNAGGQVGSNLPITNPATQKHYLITSLIEEAFTSSQLEGAVTTRQIAKEMLMSQRQPRDKSEQMILNNYYAMEFIREHRHDPLTPAMVLELHNLVTHGTLDKPEFSGKLRISDDVAVYDERSDEIIHQPPAHSELETRLVRLCDFANGQDKGGSFVHPVIRAITLHFMIGYDHPFVDGNGRTARALFYWAMLHAGYWLTEFISISQYLVRKQRDYVMAYLYVETDRGDLTYFLLHQVETIMLAMQSLNDYLQRKQQEVEQVEDLLSHGPFAGKFNHRQLALLKHATKNPGAYYQVPEHQRSHGVSYNTAKADIVALAKAGLLREKKFGRTTKYQVVSGLIEKLRS